MVSHPPGEDCVGGLLSSAQSSSSFFWPKPEQAVQGKDCPKQITQLRKLSEEKCLPKDLKKIINYLLENNGKTKLWIFLDSWNR